MNLPIVKRRTFLGGLIAFICAPAIVRATSIMPVKQVSADLIVVPYEAYFDMPDDIRRIIGSKDVAELNHFVAVPNTNLLRRALGQHLMGAEAIVSGRAEWHIPYAGSPPTSWE